MVLGKKIQCGAAGGSKKIPNIAHFVLTHSLTALGDNQGKEHESFGMSRISESQNHSIVGVGRDLCGSSSPTPC